MDKRMKSYSDATIKGLKFKDSVAFSHLFQYESLLKCEWVWMTIDFPQKNNITTDIIIFQRRAGILVGGEGNHVNLGKSWTELGLLAQCTSRLIQEGNFIYSNLLEMQSFTPTLFSWKVFFLVNYLHLLPATEIKYVLENYE